MSTAPVRKLDVTDDKFLGHSVLRTYVTNTFPKNISYLQFLNENKEKIKIFPPYAKTWEGMQSSWSKRFLREINDLGKDVIEKISIKNTLDGDSLRLIEEKSDYPQTPGHQIFPPEHNRSEYYEEDGVQTPEDFSVDDINDYPQTPEHQIFPPEHNRSEYYEEDSVQAPELFSSDASLESNKSSEKSGQDLPEINDEILEYKNTFFKTSTTELRKALNTLHPRLRASFNPQVDFVYNHIRTTVADW
ncbi:10979_t:CDS:2 [Funneliformis caledonium]|uniref:10979_t:CDS:1 n=1 Tax=Funneliformis caledonium TaxID=1117310 RepID=A0A9N9CBW3_9GLOM|nr:10979_t:CDS:2 [Funneliformis caledonium]